MGATCRESFVQCWNGITTSKMGTHPANGRDFQSLEEKADMPNTCLACSSPDLELAHQSPADHSLTSESKLRRGRLRIYLCSNCAHLMSEGGGLNDVETYYEQEYDSLLDLRESDDLYDFDSQGKPIYRSQIQLENLNRLTNLGTTGRILDFGCGKGHFLARFKSCYKNWECWGFDVSERYRAFVEPVVGPGHFQVGRMDGELPLKGPFDLITLFFVGEHLANPLATLKNVASLLAPGGFLYLTVPNILVNSIDAFLSDHLSHFSNLSLTVLLYRCGLRPIMLSEHHQLGQITLMAVPETAFVQNGIPRVQNDLVQATAHKIRESINRWINCTERLGEFLSSRKPEKGTLAVYGAGVFGSYLAIHAGKEFESISCFLDQNPFKIGKVHLGKQIVPPGNLPSHVKDILVGLNPGRARDILAQTGLLAQGDLRFFFP